MKITWILSEFFESDISRITAKILENTAKTTVYTYGNLLCKSKRDLNKIYRILTDEYFEKNWQKETEYNRLPNLWLESVKQIMS